MVCCTIEESTFGDVNGKHFFQAYCLRTYLNLIATVPLWSAALVLNWKRTPQSPNAVETDAAFVDPMKFHNIRDARQAKPQRPERKPARDPDISARLSPVAGL